MNDLGIAGPSPYRDPRASFGRKAADIGAPPRIRVGHATELRFSGKAPQGIPGLEVSEIYDPAKTQVARTTPYKPNFTTGGGIGDLPQRSSPLQIEGRGGRALVPSTRPNFTMQPNIEVLGDQPRLGYTKPTMTPQSLGSAGPQANRTSFQGPVRPAGAPPVAPPSSGGIAGPGPTRMAGIAGKVATALPGIAGGILPTVANAAYRAGDSTDGLAPVPARDPNAPHVAGTNDIIPRDPSLPANYTLPPAPRGDVFRDTEVGRNVFNTVNAIPGVGRLPGAMLRAGSTAARAVGIGGEMIRGAATANVLAGGDTQSQGIAAMPAQVDEGFSRGRGFIDPRDLRNPQPQPQAAEGIAAPAPARDTSLDITGGMRNVSDLAPSQAAALAEARLAAAGREDRPAGIAGFADSATEERNARLARQNPLDRLESAARLATSPRERAQALNAYGQLAATQDQGTSQQGIADLNNRGLTLRSTAKDRTDLAREKMANATTMRGQDSVERAHAATNKTQLGIADMQGITQREVANINSEGRIEAQLSRNLRPTVVDQGWEPYSDPATGTTTMRRLPQKVVDQYGNDITPKAASAPAWASDAKVMAIKNDTKLSDADKRKQLQALGYK